MLLKYFLKDFEMVPVAPIITGVTFVFTFHIRSSYFRITIIIIFITDFTPSNDTHKFMEVKHRLKKKIITVKAS
jgi:hypothetical protein